MITCRCVGPDIIPGASFEQKWILPIPSYLIASGTITYQQLGADVLSVDFTNSDVEAVDYKTSSITVDFTQARSLEFEELYPAMVQINFLATSGERIVTQIVQLKVGENMILEVMSNE